MRKIHILAAALIVASLLPARAADTVKIGVIYPLTGNAAPAGNSAKDAVELGVEIVNGAHPELKGLPRRAVMLRHALPNALVPTLNITAINLGYLVGGVVIVEKVYSYPGFGRLLIDALQYRDVPLIEATVLIAASVYVGANLLADLGAILLNPRLRNA